MQNPSYFDPQYNGPTVTAPPYTPPKKSAGKKIVILVVSLVLAFILMFVLFAVGIVALVESVLEEAMETEEYAIAYSYLVNSRTYQKQYDEDSEILFHSYSSSTYSTDYHGGSEVKTFGFSVDGDDYEVVLHTDHDEWYVCSECSGFN